MMIMWAMKTKLRTLVAKLLCTVCAADRWSAL